MKIGNEPSYKIISSHGKRDGGNFTLDYYETGVTPKGFGISGGQPLTSPSVRQQSRCVLGRGPKAKLVTDSSAKPLSQTALLAFTFGGTTPPDQRAGKGDEA